MTKFITLEERDRIADAFRQNQGPLLPAMIDEAVDGKIAYADLEKGLTIRFPFVEGMRTGGQYLVTLSGDDASFGIGGYIQEENQDVVVKVPSDRALAFEGQGARLKYFYLEFEEPTSPTTHFSVEGVTYKPGVDEAVDGVIPLAVLSQGVNLRIRAGSSMTPGALVSIYWWGSNPDACFVKHLNLADPVEELVMPVEPAYLMPNKYGYIKIIYTVLSTSGTWTSPFLELQVAGDLATPRAVHTEWDEYRRPARLQLIDEDGSIPMRLETQGMIEWDTAILIFVGYSRGAEFVLRHRVTASDIAAGQITFGVPVPFSSLGSSAKAWSLIERGDDEALGSPDLYMDLPPDPN
ncbi:hypothetical protein [Pseudomonas sp. R1-7]|uniref:hypothetical protein n=1 Tax=Pseudomonas sp. R1-7 TaxID=2817398 RepID=UPI003DA860BE